jgi:hypothetical protein
MNSLAATLGTPNEGRDALIAAALDEPNAAHDAWRRYRAQVLDPLADPVAMRWLPLIESNLEAIDIVADDQLIFRTARRALWVANTSRLDQAHNVAHMLAAAGIQTVLLKGAAVAQTVYQHHVLRPIGDVDVMVRPDDATAARTLLASEGWSPLRRFRDGDLAWRHALDLTKPPDGALDLHWYLLPENAWPAADRGVWSRVRRLAAQDGTFVLAPEDQLLHACAHGLRWSPVHSAHWIADAVQIVRHAESSIDWDALVREAVDRRLTLQIAAALRLVAVAGRVSVPTDALHALDARPVSWRERMETRAKTRPVVTIGGMLGIWCRWRRLREQLGPAAPPWLRYLCSAVGVDSRRALGPWLWRHIRNRAAGVTSRTNRRDTSPTPGLVVRPGRA